MYQVKTEKFEGPLELLLDLVEREEMKINELSLARVAGEYLEYIRSNDNIHLENLSDFLLVASRLILIKSRTLIPTLKLSEEEEAEIKDLAVQLEEYRKFKEISLRLGKISLAGKISFSREAFWGVKNVFYPPENINVFDLKKHFISILSEIPLIEKLQEEIVSEVITLEEKINSLQNALRERAEASFSEIVSGAEEKIDIIVSFLAMLEMVKQKIIQVEQADLFQEIRLKISRGNSNFKE